MLGNNWTGSLVRLNRPNNTMMATATATPAGFRTALSVMLMASPGYMDYLTPQNGKSLQASPKPMLYEGNAASY
jgi:hypothetical protein